LTLSKAGNKNRFVLWQINDCTFLSSEEYKNKKAGAFVIQFENEKLLKGFFGLNEFAGIMRLLKKSSSGICFSKPVSAKASLLILKLFEEKTAFKNWFF
ncbi:hypothetical protein, partial [Parafilimonas sp.]|uniref:hypothetical protein n=1 Tax=Parafilimonas sp. TaxID=1969739 RepID=UPI0039E54A72